MLKLFNHNIILPKYLEIVKKLGSSLLLPAHGWVGARATSYLAAHFAKQATAGGQQSPKTLILKIGGERDERPLDAKSDELPLTGFALRGFESNCFTLFSYIAYIAF